MYNTFLNELTEMQKRNLCDNIRVFTRGKDAMHPELVFENGYDNYASAQEAVAEERNKQRKKIMQDPQKYLQRILTARRKIDELVKDEEMKADYLKRLEDLEEEFNKEIISFTQGINK